ncbi:MAG: hypothetical protein QOF22_1646, partial [Bradyrhizobium sp.]|nr:hypothetical protein [Bradyrhizobium sp.]
QKIRRSRLSWFTRGLRYINRLLTKCLPLPELWGVMLN